MLMIYKRCLISLTWLQLREAWMGICTDFDWRSRSQWISGATLVTINVTKQHCQCWLCPVCTQLPFPVIQLNRRNIQLQGCSFKYSFALINSPYLAAKMKFDLIFKTLLMNSASEKVKCNLTTVRNTYSSKLNTFTVTLLIIYVHTISNSQQNMKISIFETLSSFDSYAQDIRIVECCVAI